MENVVKMEGLMDYKTVSKQLFLTAVRCEDSKGFASLRICDIGLVLSVALKIAEDSVIHAKVSEELCEYWCKNEEVTKADILELAMWNTLSLMPPIEIGFLSPECSLKIHLTVTNLFRKYGSVVIFLPGIADKLCDYFDSDLLFCFSSIHEAMVHPADFADLKELQKILNECIENCLNLGGRHPEEVLSRGIYHYDRRKKLFTKM